MCNTDWLFLQFLPVHQEVCSTNLRFHTKLNLIPENMYISLHILFVTFVWRSTVVFPSVLTGMLDIAPSVARCRNVFGVDVCKTAPLNETCPSNRRRRNSLCLRCSSLKRLLSWACSSEKEENLDQQEKE